MSLWREAGDASARGHRGQLALLLLAPAALWVVLLWPALHGRLYAWIDMVNTFLPYRAFYRICLQRHEWPLWCPFECRGFDFLGEGQGGAFSPIRFLLTGCLPFGIGYACELYAYFPLAWLGAYLLARRQFRFGPIPAATVAGLFAFSSPFYSHFGHLHNVWQLAHVPWLIWATLACWTARRPAFAAAALALLYASQLLLGHPEFSWIISAGIALTWALQAVWLGTWRATWRGLRWAFLGIAIGTCIAMVQIIPTLSLIHETSRGHATRAQRDNFSLHPLNLLQELGPVVFRDHSLGDDYYRTDTDFVFLVNTSEYDAYLGVGLLALLVGGTWLLRGRRTPATRRLAWAAAGLALVSLLLAFGKYGALNGLLFHLPFVGSMRCAARYIILVMFLAIVAGGWLLHRLDDEPPRPLTRGDWLGLLAPAALALAGSLVVGVIGSFQFRGQTIAFAGWARLWLGPAIALAVGLLLAWRARGGRLAIPLIAVLCLADLAISGLPLIVGEPTKPIAEIDGLPARMLATDHTYRRVAEDGRPLWEGYYIPNGFMALKPTALLDLAQPNAVRIAALRDAWLNDRLWAFPHPLPRFRLVPNLATSDDPLHDLAGVDPATTALCRPDVALPLHGPPLANGEYVDVDVDAFNLQRLHVHVAGPRLLVIADRWSPNWRLTVGRQPRPLLPLYDGAARGILVRPGDGELVLTYRSGAFRLGAKLSILGLAGLLGLFGCGWLSGRSSPAPLPSRGDRAAPAPSARASAPRP